MKWISVNERLPDLAVNVLLSTRFGIVLYGNLQRNLRSDGTLNMDYCYWWTPGPRYLSSDEVTHWMPLPPLAIIT